MTIKLVKIINDETEEVFFRIKKSMLNSIILTEQELKNLKKLISKHLGDE